MTDLAPHLAAFLHDYLPQERGVSRHTIASYADSLKLLVLFVAGQRRIRPCMLKVEDLAVPTILAFLESLEHERNNSVSTRNVRLAGVKAFFRYLEYRAPAYLDMALQVRTLSRKRTDTPIVGWLDNAQMQALLDAPDPTTPAGIRDRAMLYLCFAAGLRVSELTSLTLDSLAQPDLSTVRVIGKGRRQRTLPLWKETRAVVRQWLDIRPQVNNPFLFLNGVGKTMLVKNLLHHAVLNGFTARFTTASDMLHELAAQDSDASLARRLRRFTGPQLLAIDEVGYLNYDNRYADLLFEVVTRRYLTVPVLITTNKPFSEWGDVFSSAACVVTKRARASERNQASSRKRAEPSSTDSSIARKSSNSTAKAIDSVRPRSKPPNAPRPARAELPNPVLREDRVHEPPAPAAHHRPSRPLRRSRREDARLPLRVRAPLGVPLLRTALPIPQRNR